MLQTTTMPLSKGSLHSCTFKRIPDETRFHVVDPNVIQKVESSGKYILTYKEPDTTYLNIHELRKEMGSPNLDLCTEEIEEIPYLVSLSDRKIPITFFRIPNKEKQSAIVFIHFDNLLLFYFNCVDSNKRHYVWCQGIFQRIYDLEHYPIRIADT